MRPRARRRSYAGREASALPWLPIFYGTQGTNPILIHFHEAARAWIFGSVVGALSNVMNFIARLIEESMMANLFKLHGQNVEIVYRIGGNPSFTALTFKTPSETEHFKPSQIETATTPLGTLVTIVTRITVDAGGTTFSFFIPNLTVPFGHRVAFKSLGIIRDVSGPIIIPKDIVVTWSSVNLDGTAETVFLPL
jgi:hypothetical protein